MLRCEKSLLANFRLTGNLKKDYPLENIFWGGAFDFINTR